jgi:hypothetical protein
MRKRRRMQAIMSAGILLMAGFHSIGSAQQAPESSRANRGVNNIVLVHGAWADGSTIDPSSMQIIHLEQQRPRHDEGSGRPVAWSWSIDYARVTMDGKHFWLPKTISSKSSSLDGGGYKWSFLATYTNYHLMTVTTTVLPAAANSSLH